MKWTEMCDMWSDEKLTLNETGRECVERHRVSVLTDGQPRCSGTDDAVFSVATAAAAAAAHSDGCSGVDVLRAQKSALPADSDPDLQPFVDVHDGNASRRALLEVAL